MRKLIGSLFAVAMTILSLGGVAALSPAVYADETTPTTGGTFAEDCFGNINCTELKGDQEGLFASDSKGLMETLTTIINVVVGVVGFVAVAMIVMGGISFATSQGDSSKTTKARNTILYGVVGLVVALLAFAIVNFVLTNVF